MSKFTKRDLLFSIITGLITGFIAWQLLNYLEVRPANADPFWFVVIVPLLWILGVNLGYFLGQFLNFFNQFGKFAAIGFTNAAVDFGILFILIGTTGINKGFGYTAFKTVSFIVATMHSYFWNKFWAFEDQSSVAVGQMAKFFGVAIGAAVVNVLVASIVTNLIPPLLGFTQDQWAALGAVAGSAIALVTSFVGFKIGVFRKS